MSLRAPLAVVLSCLVSSFALPAMGQVAASCAGAAGTGNVTVHAPALSATPLRMCDGYALQSSGGLSNATPLTLASADFDGDGTLDLVAGYGSGGAGTLTVYRGNVAALWPYGDAVKNGAPAPFLPNAKTVSLPVAPDFLVTGDFDADGKWDIVAAASGSSSLYFLKGDGHGGFAAPKAVALPGAVTALIAGEMGQKDGLADLAIGVATEGGAKALVMSGPRGAIKAAPQSYTLSTPATALAFGRFDGNATFDLAIAGGSQIVVLHGRDALNEDSLAGRPLAMTVQQVGFTTRAMTAGDFTASGIGLAVLDSNGTVHVMQHAILPGSLAAMMAANAGAESFAVAGKSDDKNGVTGASHAAGSPLAAAKAAAALGSVRALGNGGEWTEEGSVAMPGGFAQQHPQLIAARMTGALTEDLIAADSSTSQLHVLSRLSANGGTALRGAAQMAAPMKVFASLSATTAPAVVLPMRLNQHGLAGLVALQAGQGAPTVMPHDVSPTNIFTVTNTLDSTTIGGTPPAGSLRAAMLAVNSAYSANGGSYEIAFNIPTSDPNYNAATGVYLIRPLSENLPNSLDNFALPPINAVLTIDGYTQPGASPNTLAVGSNAKIAIQIDGSRATTQGGSGLSPYFDSGSIFRGLSLTGWANPYTANGTSSGAEGIEANGAGDYIEGNYIGIDPTGTVAPNRIGIFGDNGPGLGSTAPGNVIGGTTPQARNVIVGNNLANVLLLSTCVECQVQGNYVGLDPSGSRIPTGAALGDGVGTNGPTMQIGSPIPGGGNVIAGNNVNVDLNDLTRGGAARNSTVQANLIGLDATGTKAISGNTSWGISLQHAVTLMQIGGTSPAARNVSSGAFNGVILQDASNSNTIQGNYIGTDITGKVAVPNSTDGLLVAVGPANVATSVPQASVYNVIGGTVAGAGNVVSGNSSNGIHIQGAALGGAYNTPQGNTVQGNFIGTDATGAGALPNNANGVYLDSRASQNAIGGGGVGVGNTISFNNGAGVYVDTSGTDGGYGAGNAVSGNTILSNKGAGVFLNTGVDNPVRMNSIYSNGALGIDLAPAGVNAPLSCGTAGSGANNHVNAPVLTAGTGSILISATATDSAGNTSEFSNTVKATGVANLISLVGSYVGVANSTYTLDFFQSATADASGYGQGQTYIGSVTVTTDGSCNGTVNKPVDLNGADVAVSIKSSILEVGPDLGSYTYTATVSNSGPATAHNVVFTDALPNGVSVSSLYCNTAACQSPITTTAGTCSVSGTTVTCNIAAMAPGQSATIVIPVYLTVTGSVSNTATVKATETDPVMTNNTSTDTNTSYYPFLFEDHATATTALVGQPALVSVYGVGIYSGTTVTFNGQPVTGSTIFDNQYCNSQNVVGYCAALQVPIPASMLTTAGTYTLELDNPSPQLGGSSYSIQQPITVVAGCTYSVSPTSFTNLDANGTNLIAQSVYVSPSAPSCTWTATSQTPWFQILDTNNGSTSTTVLNQSLNQPVTGTGYVDLTYNANGTTAARSGTITVAGVSIPVSQVAGTATTPTEVLSTTTTNFPVAGGSGSFTVTSNNTGYFVQAYAPWITVAKASGLLSGNGTVNYTVAANPGAPRSGTILVGSVAFTVTQDSTPCYYTLSSNSATPLPVGGGTGTFNVTANSGSCAYTVKSSDPGVTVTSGASATGNSTVNYSVAANTGGPKNVTITVSDGTASSVYSIVQTSAYTCTFSLSPNVLEVPSTGYANYVTLNASEPFCKWAATSNNPDGVTLTTKTSGTGSNVYGVYYNVGQNTSTSSRTLTLTLGCQTFTITQDGVPASVTNPTLTALAPSSVTAGSGAFTLTLTGTGFQSGAVVSFHGVNVPTMYVSATSLTAAIPASAVAAAGTALVKVTNPDTGVSNSLNFTINAAVSNPTPAITGILPNSAAAGAADTTITVTGSGFLSTSAVNVNGAPVATTYTSATALSAVIPKASLANAGTLSVTVVNPSPGGGTSNATTFTVTGAVTSNPVPAIASLSPATAVAGSGGFTLTVTGTGFVNGSVVNWNGAARTTTFGSATQLMAAIPAADVAAAGTVPVTVTNAAPGGGTSAAANFTVTAATTSSATFTPTSATFGNTTVGTAATAQTLTVTNSGNQALTITGVAISGANASSFAQTNTCGTQTLAAGVTCTVQVVFTPASAGALTATLTVTGTTGTATLASRPAPMVLTNVTATAALTGTGVAAAVPTFNVGASGSTSQTVTGGGAASYTILVSALNGTYGSAVALTASGLPAGATATFNPASVTPGSTSATSTLMVQTAKTAAAGMTKLWMLVLSVPLLAGMMLMRRRRYVTLLLFLLGALGTLGALTGCGGGFGSAVSTPASRSYTITVTGTSGSVTQTTTVQLTVQ